MLKIVFDMDGVIFDTETMCTRSWKYFEKEFGVRDTEKTFQLCIGANHEWALDVLRRTQGVDFPAEEFLKKTAEWMRRTIRQDGIPVKKGAKELLSWLREQNAAVALASSTRTATVREELGMAGLLKYFQVIIGGDMVQRSKPNPDIYLCACRELGINPCEGYAIEDSYNGVRSAGSAGMKVLMVPDRLAPTEEMEELAQQILPDLVCVKEYLSQL